MPVKGVSLHIGLNYVDPVHYDNWDGRLYGCVNDADLLESLAMKNGFSTIKLLNEQATSTNLMEALKSLSNQLERGDILLISYSGHGGSMPDLNKDEVDLFSKDETWCLYDRQVIDDELYDCYSKFKAGVRIFIFSDSCHSGSVARGVTDNEENIEISEDLKELYKGHTFGVRRLPATKAFPIYCKNKAFYDVILNKDKINKDELKAFVLLFAACQDNETAKEWGEHGIFTGAFKNLLQSTFNTYDQLFEEIKRNIPVQLQVPNMNKYGNAQFDFSSQFPFVIDGNNQGIFDVSTTPAKEKKEMVIENDIDLIIHINDKSSTRNRAEPLLPGGEVQNENTESLLYKIRTENTSLAQAWDKAYVQSLATKDTEKSIRFIEPNIKSKYARVPDAPFIRGDENNYMATWPSPAPGKDEFIWHLDEDHSQLRKACLKVTGNVLPFGLNFNDERLKIRIGHIDTGYLDHVSKPLFLNEDLGVSFVKSEIGINKGKDELNTGSIAEQDGHGCATMAILAGNKITDPADSYAGYTDYFGAIPFAEIIPVRICDTVYNFFNANDVADGIDFAVDQGCEVITMSMAGYPTKRVANAVNRAYSKGVIVVTASGNNWFKGLQKITPKAVMYPARFERVIAVTGACFNHLPYDSEANDWHLSRTSGGETMQGNWGPGSAMKTAIAAYTPNLPWATFMDGYKFSRSGGGTSSSTPQVAATVALWIIHNRDKIKEKGLEGNWKKVEAARKAIFRSASKSYPDYKKYYGNGIIRAYDALDNFNFDTEVSSLKESPAARVLFGGLPQFIGQWFRGKAGANNGVAIPENDEVLQEMLSLEIIQLVYRSIEDGGDEHLMNYAAALELESDDAADFLNDPVAKKKFTDAVKNSVYASEFLKGVLQ